MINDGAFLYGTGTWNEENEQAPWRERVEKLFGPDRCEYCGGKIPKDKDHCQNCGA